MGYLSFSFLMSSFFLFVYLEQLFFSDRLGLQLKGDSEHSNHMCCLCLRNIKPQNRAIANDMHMHERWKGGEVERVLLTASHSLISSPGGSLTASLKFPLPNVASICFLNCAPCNCRKGEKTKEDDLINAFF